MDCCEARGSSLSNIGQQSHPWQGTAGRQAGRQQEARRTKAAYPTAGTIITATATASNGKSIAAALINHIITSHPECCSPPPSDSITPPTHQPTNPILPSHSSDSIAYLRCRAYVQQLLPDVSIRGAVNLVRPGEEVVHLAYGMCALNRTGAHWRRR